MRNAPAGPSHRKRSAVTGCLTGVPLLAPARQETVEPDGVDDGAREDMGADLGPLLQHHHRQVRRDLLQPDRRRQAGRPGADDHHVDVHRLAFRQLGIVGHAPPQCSISRLLPAVRRLVHARRANLA